MPAGMPARPCRSDGELLVTLITRHLVRLLKTAPNLQVLDGATLAIQELLRSYSRADGLRELAAQQAAQGGGRQAQGQASRETSPADSGVAEGNLLFAALAPEVQVSADRLAAVGLRSSLPRRKCTAVGHKQAPVLHLLHAHPAGCLPSACAAPLQLYCPHHAWHACRRPLCGPTSTPSTTSGAWRSGPAPCCLARRRACRCGSGSSCGSPSWCSTTPRVGPWQRPPGAEGLWTLAEPACICMVVFWRSLPQSTSWILALIVFPPRRPLFPLVAPGNQLKLFQSVMPACRFDIPTCLFLMPYLLHNVLAHGTDDARQSVQQEIQARTGGLACGACCAWQGSGHACWGSLQQDIPWMKVCCAPDQVLLAGRRTTCLWKR